MRLRTSFFNKAIFLKNVKRFWPLWMTYLIILIFLIPVSMANRFMYSADPSGISVMFSVLWSAQRFCLVLTPIFGGISALAVFSYLYNSKSAGMMASLPIKRGAMFFTNYFTGLAWTIAANLIVFLAAAVVGSEYGMPVIGALLGWLGMNILLTLFFYSFACFCAVLTGSIVTMPLLYIVMNFTAVSVELIIQKTLNICLYGITTSGNLVLKFLSPIVMLWDKAVMIFDPVTGSSIERWAVYDKNCEGLRIVFEGAGAYALYAAAGIVFAVLACIIYRRRHMETASDVVAVKPLRPIFRYCMTFGCALVIGILLYSSAFPSLSPAKEAVFLTLSMVCGGFIGYFASEMMMQKSFRVFDGRWRGFIVSALIIVALMAAVESDIIGLEKHVPKKESIESIYITANERMNLSRPENIDKILKLHRNLTDNKRVYEEARYSGFYEAPGESYDSQRMERVVLDYKLSSGRPVSRIYWIFVSENQLRDPDTDAYLLNSIINSDEAIKARKKTDVEVNERNLYSAMICGTSREDSYIEAELNKKQAIELYDCILKDLNEGTLGKIWLYGGAEYEATVYDGNIYFDLTELRADGSYASDRFRTVPTKNSRWTNEYLKSIGIEFMTIGEAYKNLYQDENKPLKPIRG